MYKLHRLLFDLTWQQLMGMQNNQAALLVIFNSIEQKYKIEQIIIVCV